MLRFYPYALCIIFLFAGCTQKKAETTSASFEAVKDSISLLVNNTAKNITAKGPIGWLDEFENSPDFYMVNDGAIAFKDYPTAEKFVRDTLSKKLQRIELTFSNMRITPLGPESGNIGAEFNEVLVFSQDTALPFGGYFTATAHHSAEGWKLLNLHWSTKK